MKIKHFFLTGKKIFSYWQVWLLLNTILVLLAVVLSIKAASLVIDYYFHSSTSQPAENNLVLTQPPKATTNPNFANKERRLIDGIYVDKKDASLWPVAVMIDNHPEARPPAALAQANLVFEAPVEGSITRFLAIYSLDKEIAKIGPIRSARPYFLAWALGINALYVHCGGSPQALARIKKDRVLDLNEFYQGHYFWRARNRFAPHNVYISSVSLKSYLQKLDLGPAQFSAWQYQDDAATSSQQSLAANIIIAYPRKDFDIKWKYDKIKKTYIRYQAGKKHQDEDGAVIMAKNIIIMQTKVKVIDAEGRLDLQTKGENKAWLCQLSFCQPGIWRKHNLRERIQFFGLGGKRFVFLPGPTWIEVVSNLNIVKLTNS